MLITLKNLQQQTFQVDIDPTKTVKELKQKINSEKGNEYPADQQRLIYAGKILADDRPVSEYNIDEKKFIVVMVTQPKAAPTPHTGPHDPTQIQTDSADTADKTTAPVPTTPSAQQRQESGGAGAGVGGAVVGGSSSLSADAESALIMGDQYNSMVQNIVELGYDRDQVEKALRASFNNPDRAVEYLISGIPADPDLQEQPAQGEDSEPLGFLRTQPQFQQMRQVVQQNPELLNAVLQQIGQSNPALLQLISQNQEAFVRMLNEPVGAGGNQPQTPQPTPQGGGGGGGGGNTGGQQVTQVPVTPQDKEAIERLKALGFPEHLVVQAYFACEKNENLAANFLLSQNMDD